MQRAMDDYGIPACYTDYARMLAESDAAAVINLTPIALHDATNRAILASGRHLYTEKPPASSSTVAGELAALAAAHGLTAVCAPSIALFPQMAFVRALLAEGAIGEIYSARGYGHLGVPPWEGYPSDPSPFFARGAGPAMDMGVYPLHALTALLGPVQRVTAFVAHVLDHFTVTDGPFAGTVVPVQADDNWQMILDFGGGRLASVAANNVVVDTRCPPLELHGLAGTIAFDPIYVEQPVQLLRRGQDWQTITPPFPHARPGRNSGPDHILGIEHLLDCLDGRTTLQLGLDQAAHVLRILEAAAESSRTGRAVAIHASP
ncbi:MAG: Gfo/Idh/MocA family oxidoreductase [Caldilineaceae bacterium]|nr:Gfo/Idh/MocA family oxidoreductase [Caldilineaceae bacterium]